MRGVDESRSFELCGVDESQVCRAVLRENSAADDSSEPWAQSFIRALHIVCPLVEEADLITREAPEG